MSYVTGVICMNTANKIIAKDHYLLNIQDDVNAICKDFFNDQQIFQFTYLRYYDDKSCQILITHGDIIHHHLNKEYILVPHLSEKLINEKICYIPTPDLDDGFSDAVSDYRDMFNMMYPVYLFERYENYFDLFVFTSKLNNTSSINYYLNNMQNLENFKLYFKDKAAKLIKEASKNRIHLPDHMLPNFGGLNSGPIKKDPLMMPIKSIDLGGNGASITKRELEIFKHLINGLTVKESSALLNISSRTAETHVSNVKCKLGVKKKSEALKILRSNYLL